MSRGEALALARIIGEAAALLHVPPTEAAGILQPLTDVPILADSFRWLSATCRALEVVMLDEAVLTRFPSAAEEP